MKNVYQGGEIRKASIPRDGVVDLVLGAVLVGLPVLAVIVAVMRSSLTCHF